jgi:valyl-tRNA synthetase
MACTRYVTSVQELVDGTLGAIRRAEMEAHLENCADCRALLADLERIHDAAGALGPLPLPDGAWLQIAGRLRQQGRVQSPSAAPRRGIAPARMAFLAVAAALVLAVGVSLLRIVPRTQPPAAPAPPTASVNPPDAQAIETVQNEVEQAQKQMETAISHMEQIAKANQQALDSKTAATLDRNLNIIDQAIAENRAAVKAEPNSVTARNTLFEALKQKVSLLQETISLMNEMRKGNNAGAAQIVNGLNKS